MKRLLWISGVFMLMVVVLSVSCDKDSPTGPGDDESLVYNGITFVAIPGGTFRMGNVDNDPYGYSDEKPVHTVTVSSFEMSIYEVTNAQYAEYLNSALNSGDITATSGSVTGKAGDYSGEEYLDLDDSDCEISYRNGKFTVDSGKESRPVIEVTWYGSKSFALYNEFDLPTEAEWEYACRAGTETKFYTGNDLSSDGETSTDLDRAGWYWDNAEWSVLGGQKEPNAWGLYDMHGNLEEWCHDLYDEDYYSESLEQNPTGAHTSSSRVVRSGSQQHDAIDCRSTSRENIPPDASTGFIGFRVVRRPGEVTH